MQRLLDHPAFQIALVLGTLLAMASPTLWPKPTDDFPLSPYAMFASKKDATTTVTNAVATRPDGEPIILAPRFFDTDEVLQARVTLDRTRKRGKRAVMELCWDLAKRVAADPTLADRQGVELRTVTYDTLGYFDDPAHAEKSKVVHAHCKVDR